MKYSNGFYIFHCRKNESLPNKDNHYIKRYNSVDSFECYYFYFLVNGFHEVPVWIDNNNHLLVIFLRNYDLIPNVMEALRENFKYECEKYITFQRTISGDNGEVNIFSDGSVLTDLVGSNHDRLSLLKDILCEKYDNE
ncbi:hypothetical protein [Paenibacillus humicus]|uniref:hypothetical protein n=1 Tax=Paenibacillus humicus TaxID=412861 RepID=UPI003F14C9D3